MNQFLIGKRNRIRKEDLEALMDDNINFTEEALKAQHGKKVPLKAFPGGPVIGEATLKYDPDSQSLNAEMQVDDPMMAKILGNNPSSVILRQGKFKQGE